MKLKYNRPNTYTCIGVRLLPGINTVDDEKAKRFMAQPGVKARVDAGVIEKVTGKEAEPGKEPTAAELKKDIPEMYDVARLRELAEDERKGVADAAAKRLKEIEDATNPNGEGGE